MAGIFFIQKASCKVRVVPVPKIIWKEDEMMVQWVLWKSYPKLWRFISYVPYLFILEWKRVRVNGHGAMRLWPEKHCIIWTYQNTWKTMEASEKVVKVNWYFHCWGFVGKLIGWRFWLAAFNWGFAGGFDFFYLPIDFETKKNKVPMLETHGDSDERGGVGSGFCQLSVSSLVKNVCWFLVLYTAPEVYFILGKNPAFPSSIRFYPINSYQRSYLGFLLFS